ncbi:T9SS type A sorting domain-containing protein [Flavobacteriales bacterium]|nr:T9SS type A sorting domain-containing protein [Flavobacteriales bacterium]
MRKVLYFLLLLVFSITNNLHSQCHYLMYMYDSYGDGWNSAYLEVNMNGTFVGNFDCSQNFTLDSVYSTTGAAMEFIWHSGNYDNEISFTIMDPMGDTLINIISASDLDDLDFFTHTSNSTCQNNNPCLSPIFLNAGNITPNSADLLWQAAGNETSWNLEWGVSGFNLGSGTIINGLTNTNYSLSSLTNNTNYDFYVQAICDSNTNSTWQGPYSFTTNNPNNGGTCGNYTLELYDSFGDGWNGGSIDVVINGSVFQNVTLVNGTGPEVFIFSTDSNDVIDLIYNTNQYPEENTYNLIDQSGNVIVGQGLFGFIPNVDPVSTFGIVACTSCPPPSNLSANTSTAGNALLGWIGGNGTFNTEWGTAGFALGSGNLINSISTNSYLLNGLNNGTTYDFYVQEACSANEISTWAGPFSFTTSVAPGSCGIFNLELSDSYGDGWNGGSMDVVINGNIALTGLTILTGGGPEIFQISVNIGDLIDIIYNPGGYPEENSYIVFDENGVLKFEEGAGQIIPNSILGIEACPTCPAPSNLSANTSTASTALLDWTGGSSPFGGTFNIEWGPTGFNPGNGTIVNNINGVNYLLNGLGSITTYDYYVQEVCNANDLSSWVGPLTFTTIYFSSGSECGVYNLKLINNSGQGWGNSFAKVKINNNLYQTYTLSNGTSETFSFPLDSSDILDIVIEFSSSGVWGSDLNYILFDPNNAIIASEQGTGSNEPPANTYGYQACATAPSSNNDFCDIYTLIMRKAFGGDWQGNVEIEINNNIEYVGSFVAGGYRRSEPISFGVRGNDEVRVIANGLNGFDEYYSVQNSSGDTIIDASTGNSPTVTVQPCYFVGLENLDINRNIKIYPNPTRDILFISSASEINNIIITNIYGQIVYENYETGLNFELDLSSLSNNLYHISFTDANNIRSSSKIMVSH